MPKIEINRQAPHFASKDLNGQLFSLADHLGKTILLVFNRGFG